MADYAIHDTTLIAQADIIRKKFGTSDSQDPAEYADKMNLMGVLEEKAATAASICSFSDGSDDVPMSSVVAHIAPSLTGKNAVNMKQAKKNLLPIIVDYPNFESEKNSMTCTLLPNGKLKFNGTTTASTDFTFYPASTPNAPHLYVPNGEYTFSNIGSNDIKMVVSGGSNNGFPYREIVNTSYTGNVTDDTKPFNYVVFRIASGVTLSNVVIEPMLEVGSSASSYEPYAEPTTYTANLGRTVYGADADLVSGQGKETYGYIVFDGSSDENWGGYSAYNGYYIDISDMKSGTRQDGVCNQLACSKSTTQGQTNAFWLGAGNKRLYVIGVYDSMGSTLEAFKAYLAENPLILVYPLATETDFTFDGQEIPSLLGVNNLWHEDGNTEAVYRSSGTVTPVPIQPVLVSKTITENGVYLAEDDDADGYDEVTVAVQSATCERLMYARCVNNDQEEIPAISNIDQGTNYSTYLSYDSTTKKFTVLQNFTGVVIAWVYAYRAYEASRPDGSFYVNSTQMLSYTATGNAAGSTGGRSGIFNFKQGDTFWMYTPTRRGYPQQNCKVYRVSDLNDNVFTFADEEETE